MTESSPGPKRAGDIGVPLSGTTGENNCITDILPSGRRRSTVVVGEEWDRMMNNARGLHIGNEHTFEALETPQAVRYGKEMLAEALPHERQYTVRASARSGH